MFTRKHSVLIGLFITALSLTGCNTGEIEETQSESQPFVGKYSSKNRIDESKVDDTASTRELDKELDEEHEKLD
jgi:hypothetical protein